MEVELLFFGGSREQAGTDRARVTLPPSVETIGDTIEWLGREYPLLLPRLRALRIARNAEFATSGERVHDGDVLAVIPPVSGG